MVDAEWTIDVNVPEDATPAQEEALIQAAVDKKIDDDIDGMLGGMFK
jgi:hypothetical protein